MIDPVIISFEILGREIVLRWYGLILMSAVLAGTWLADREFRRRGGSEDFVWNALIWILPAGVIGARLWYVLNATLGGSRYYIDDPSKILAISEGGLHIFGGLLLGGYVAYLYAKRHKADFLMILDSIGPSLLIAQALARPANFINQELYGQPTGLPWGISILEENRIGEWTDLARFPVETTRFHPTFAYEMAWNLVAGGLLLYFSRRFPDKFKPGAVFAAWLVLAGLGRFIVEFFRPDQPRIPGTLVSYSQAISGLMAVAGTAWLLVRTGKIQLSFWKPAREKYDFPRKRQRKLAQRRRRTG
ncbi:MAG TPA: prolipoprotein diacylglyceryl transferase [Anaerolineales bacterium]|nr:prolipoprotein diacylglyceryl transferase [Anaerolineales bacterium]